MFGGRDDLLEGLEMVLEKTGSRGGSSARGKVENDVTSVIAS